MKSTMAGWGFSCFVWHFVTFLAVCVHCNDHHGPGGHHGPPPGGHHGPPPDGHDSHERQEEEDPTDCIQPYDEDADKGPRITYIMAVVIGCLVLVGIVAAIAVCRYKKRKLHNKIRSDPRTTPVISVVDYKLPPYDPSNKKKTPLPPYEPSNKPSNKTGPTLPPVEGTAPPAYDYVPPWSPPPPYSVKEAGLNDK